MRRLQKSTPRGRVLVSGAVWQLITTSAPQKDTRGGHVACRPDAQRGRVLCSGWTTLWPGLGSHPKAWEDATARLIWAGAELGSSRCGTEVLLSRWLSVGVALSKSPEAPLSRGPSPLC